MGPGGFFPANPDLADIFGRTLFFMCWIPNVQVPKLRISKILDVPASKILDFPASENLDFLASKNLDIPASKKSTRRPVGGRAGGRAGGRKVSKASLHLSVTSPVKEAC